ncbi:MAG TPA: hypothetical protein VIU11_23735 [Nakamurella sp.]
MNEQINADARTIDRHARRVVALEVQVAELERSRRRTLMLGPSMLLVLANVTPLVIAHPKNDPDESYTLTQLVFGAVKALPVGWFLLLGLVGLACLGAAAALPHTVGRRSDSWLVVASGVGMLAVLAVLVVVVSSASTKNTSYLSLSPATVLGAAAAIWLVVGARSVRG